MRIDSMTYFTSSLAGIQSNQTAISRLNQQIATGLTMLATKDDPVTAVKAMELSNRIAMRTQYAANQDKAELDLNYETVVMEEMSSAMIQARTLLVGVSPSQSVSARNVNAEQLKGVFNHLLGLANTRDPSGNYIFAGYETATKPFVNAGGGVPTDYYGTSQIPVAIAPDGTTAPGGSRWSELDVGRYIQVNDNMDQVIRPIGGSDLLQELGEAIVNLPGATITQTDIDGYVAVLDTAISKLGLIEHRVAGALTELTDLRASTQALLLNEKNALSDMTQVDQAAAIVELQSRQTSLEAISRAYSLTSGLSLFNYLG